LGEGEAWVLSSVDHHLFEVLAVNKKAEWATKEFKLRVLMTAFREGNSMMVGLLAGLLTGDMIEEGLVVGNSGCVDVIFAAGYGKMINEETMNATAGAGIVEGVVALRERMYAWSENTTYAAAEGGHLLMLDRLMSAACPWNPHLVMCAAHNGHLAVVAYVRECHYASAFLDPEIEQSTLNAAASGGQLRVLEYLRSKGCRFTATTCMQAARAGQLATLEYLREHGAPWDEHVPACAAREGYLDVVRYAIGNGCPWGLEECIEAARAYRFEDIVEYLIRADAETHAVTTGIW
jgi:hypothetical protein